MKSIFFGLLRVIVFFTACVGLVEAQTVTFFHNDISGTPLLATGETGSVLWRENYHPYGGKINKESASLGNKIGFHGKPYDDAVGLSYMGARYYDPVVGRFLSMDPQGFNEENIHSFNRYAYANNNPYKYVDPDGELPVLAVPLIIKGVDLALTAVDLYAATQTGGATGLIKSVAENAVTSVIPGGKIAAKIADKVHDAASLSKTIHGNSKLSDKPQIGYEIVDNFTGKVAKTGITGAKPNKDGSAPRAISQVNKWNREPGNEGRYEARYPYRDSGGEGARLRALEWEKGNAEKLRSELDPMRHSRP